MRKIGPQLLIIAILIFILQNIAFAFPNEPDGFRRFKWGDPPKSLRLLKKQKDGLWIYASNLKLFLGDANLERIFYTFYGKPRKFMAVGLYFKGKQNYKTLKNICQEKFGEPMSTGFFELSWIGLKAYVDLNYDLVDGDGYLLLASTKISMEYMESSGKKELKEIEKDW